MKVTKLIVPKGVRYISEWKEYDLNKYNFPHILDKKLTGCGFTEYCISLDNPMNIILCSPRRILLENKESQHIGEVFYARNDSENCIDFEKDLSKTKSKLIDINSDTSKDSENSIMNLKTRVRTWYFKCKDDGIPCKLLVTYDSFRHVLDALGECIQEFYTVVDEFQSIFIDSRFKSTTEMEFLNIVKRMSRVCFVSATPMMQKYLEMLEEFQDLPYFELDWSSEDPSRLVKPNLDVKFTRKLSVEADRVVQSYLSGNFSEATLIDSEGFVKTVKSTEVVLYFNSVKAICDIIRRNSLTLSQVNVLCSDTKSNRDKVSKALECSKESAIGSIPKKGEKHKMFTLCTRTVYLGSDFYSTCAQSYIFSDSNVDCLSVDISMDLNQILGRQRLNENPWKNSANLIVNIHGEKLSEKDFEEYVNKKEKATFDLLEAYKSVPLEYKHAVAKKYQNDVIHSAYKSDYISVNTHGGKDLFPVFNKLVKISELRTFEVQKKDYKDRFSLMSTLEDSNIISKTTDLNSFLNRFENLKTFVDKMRYLCTYPEDSPLIETILNLVPMDYKNYYTTLGRSKLMGLGYNITRIRKEYENMKILKNREKDPVFLGFKVGEKLSLSEIRDRLKIIYEREGIVKTPRATDLNSRFTLKRFRFRDENKNRVEGFELLPLESPSGDS